MTEQLTHFIDGARTPGTSGNFQDVFNPATGELVPRNLDPAWVKQKIGTWKADV